MYGCRYVAGAIALLALLVACGSAPSSTRPSSSPISTPELRLERFGAPPITRPRSVAALASSTCALLDQKARGLGYEGRPEQRTTIAGVVACNWSSASPRRTASTVVWNGEDYFVDVYRARLMAIFRPIEVGELPAVQQQSVESSTLCTTTVGIADWEALDITTVIDELEGGRPITDPCAEGRRVAEAIVATLPPA